MFACRSGLSKKFMIIVYRFYYVYDNIIRPPVGSRPCHSFHSFTSLSCDFQISISFMSEKCQNLLPLKSIASNGIGKSRTRNRNKFSSIVTCYTQATAQHSMEKNYPRGTKTFREETFCWVLCGYTASLLHVSRHLHSLILNHTFATTGARWRSGAKTFRDSVTACLCGLALELGRLYTQRLAAQFPLKNAFLNWKTFRRRNRRKQISILDVFIIKVGGG